MNRFMKEFNPEQTDIAVCGSMSHMNKFMEVINQLKSMGFSVSTPDMTEKFDWSTFDDDDIRREKGRLVRRHFANISRAKVALVCNYEKNNIEGYIGVNTLMEMACAFAYEKPIYLLNGIPSQNGREEIIAMDPIVINGDLAKIEVGI